MDTFFIWCYAFFCVRRLRVLAKSSWKKAGIPQSRGNGRLSFSEANLLFESLTVIPALPPPLPPRTSTQSHG